MKVGVIHYSLSGNMSPQRSTSILSIRADPKNNVFWIFSILHFISFSCLSYLNFWDEAWWFLSFTVFGLLSSSLLLYLQHFSRYVLQSSSGVSSRTHSVTVIGVGSQNFKETIILRLQVQSWQQVSNNTVILNTCTRLWLTESEQMTPVD